MPELPEVEAVKRSLENKVLNHYLHLCPKPHPTIWQNKTAPELDEMQPFFVAKIERFGKYLLFTNEQAVLRIHLRMTGRLLVQNEPLNLPPHTHVRWQITKTAQKSDDVKDLPKSYLLFADIRRFGRVELFSQAQIKTDFPTWLKLGIEPLTVAWSAENFHSLCKRHPKLQLKAFLLNQQIISGLGNIYADEICFAAGLHPQTPIRKLRKKDCASIVKLSEKILQAAISARGTSFRDYVDADGKKGDFALSLMVYGRKNQVCRICNTELERIKLAGRTSTFCPTCQPKPKSKPN